MTHEEIVANCPWGQSGVVATRAGVYTAVVMLFHKNQSIQNGYRSEFRGFKTWGAAYQEACRRLEEARPCDRQDSPTLLRASLRTGQPAQNPSLGRGSASDRKLLIGHRQAASGAKNSSAESIASAEPIAERAMARLRRREQAIELTRHLRTRRPGSASKDKPNLCGGIEVSASAVPANYAER
jgi:hypothetical protein